MESLSQNIYLKEKLWKDTWISKHKYSKAKLYHSKILLYIVHYTLYGIKCNFLYFSILNYTDFNVQKSSLTSPRLHEWICAIACYTFPIFQFRAITSVTYGKFKLKFVLQIFVSYRFTHLSLFEFYVNS